jgi:RNA polymerase sigma factor (sigma-70 family)
MANSANGTILRAVRAATSVVRATDRELLTRFAGGDQSAFATLVNRHATMVLGVCRRALPTVQDAEDACQAVFLTLANRAGAGDWRESVANWLYTTARRVAWRVNRSAARRTRREARATVPASASPLDQITGRELVTVLDEELDKLPALCREPLVLCYLEGLTRDEAATRLGVSAATLKSRLDSGRKKLGAALTRRGFVLGAGLLALVVTSPAGASPPRLVESVLATVTRRAPARIGELARGGAANGLFKKTALALVVMAGIVGGAAGVWSNGNRAAEPPVASAVTGPVPARVLAASAPMDADPAAPQPGDKTDDRSNDASVSGRVLGSDGKPLPGAELLLVGKGPRPKKLGVSGSDGRFTVSAPRTERWVNLVARADGVGIDFVDLSAIAPTAEVELRLVKDRAVRGRIVDTQGKPVVGATVQVKHVGVYGDNNLDPFLAEWKTRTPYSGLPGGRKHVSDDALFPLVTTDKDGRFAVAGVGDERLVELRISGAGIAADDVWVVNRAGFDPKPSNRATEDNLAQSLGFGMRWLLYGPEPSVVAEAEKPIRGVVKDKDTGKPRVGVTVTLSRYGQNLAGVLVSATTDAEGRYEIRGARKAKEYMVEVPNDPTTGHVAAQGRADDTAGYEPITIDLGVKKGVIVTGRVIDKGTGKPVPGFVMTDALNGNSFVKDYPEYHSSAWIKSESTGSDGTFRVVAFPGAVILMGGPDTRRMPDREIAWHRYKPAPADPMYPKFVAMTQNFGRAYFGTDGASRPLQGLTYAVLEIPGGTATVEQDLVLEPAPALPVKIRTADGKPAGSVLVTGLGSQDWRGLAEVKADACAVYALDGKPRLLVFYEPTRKLFGTLTLKGDEKESVTVTLGPGGGIAGRLVGEDGKPLAGVAVRASHRARAASDVYDHTHRARVETDAEGKFRIDDIVPGVKCELWFTRGTQSFEPVTKAGELTTEPGKLTDVGELKLKPGVRPGG